MIPENSEFDRLLTAVEEAYKRLPNGVATVAVNFFKERFRAQNWVDRTTVPWKKRKDSDHWASKRQRNSRRALLVNTGRLRRSIRKISATTEQIVIGTDVPYARIHNDGFRGVIEQNVKAHTRQHTDLGITRRRELKTRTRIEFGRVRNGSTSEVKAHKRRIRVNIPQRQYIGQSATLNRDLEKFIMTELIKAIRK